MPDCVGSEEEGEMVLQADADRLGCANLIGVIEADIPEQRGPRELCKLLRPSHQLAFQRG